MEFRGYFIYQDGVEKLITLKDVLFVKGREVNFFSLTKETEANWSLSGDKNHIRINYQDTIMIFKENMDNINVHVFENRLYAQNNVDTEFNFSLTLKEKRETCDINKLSRYLENI